VTLCVVLCGLISRCDRGLVLAGLPLDVLCVYVCGGVVCVCVFWRVFVLAVFVLCVCLSGVD